MSLSPLRGILYRILDMEFREFLSVLKKSSPDLSAGSKRPKTVLSAPQQEPERAMNEFFNTLFSSRHLDE